MEITLFLIRITFVCFIAMPDGESDCVFHSVGDHLLFIQENNYLWEA